MPKRKAKYKLPPHASNHLARRRNWLNAALQGKPVNACPKCDEPMVQTIRSLVCTRCAHKVAI